MANSYTPVVRVQLVREYSLKLSPVINGSAAAQEFAKRFFTDRSSDREAFAVAHLDTKNKVISAEVVTVGTLNASLIHPREVFKAAIVNNAASVLLMHNHPSGDPTPSPQDWEATRSLVAAGQLLGIAVVDHVIVGDDTTEECQTLSLREERPHMF